MEFRTFINFIKRVLLFQNLIYFSILKFDNIINSQNEFFHKLKMLLLDLGFSIDLSNINIPENDDIIFRIILIFIITSSFLSILNFAFTQFICGIISIFIGFVYYNPFLKYNELITRNIILNLANGYNYLPSFELLFFVGCGIAMIGQSLKQVNLFYYIFCCCFNGDCEENSKERKNRKCKINLQFEFDVDGNSSNNSSFKKSDI